MEITLKDGVRHAIMAVERSSSSRAQARDYVRANIRILNDIPTRDRYFMKFDQVRSNQNNQSSQKLDLRDKILKSDKLCVGRPRPHEWREGVS